MTRKPAGALLIVMLALFVHGHFFFRRGQRYSDFTTPTPLPPNQTLIIGILGGREPWNQDQRAIRKLALKLRAMNLPGVHVETLENTKRRLAVELVRNAFDRNRDATLDSDERASARLILYGQSFGGAAVVKLARQLKKLNVPILLTVQIDSVGLGDAVIPSNVRQAANLYQGDGWIIRGEPAIRAEDPERTVILGNFRFGYAHKKIDISGVPWFKKVFRVAHAKMEHDPEVWAKVEELILATLKAEGIEPRPGS